MRELPILCGARIFFAITERNKKIPVDAEKAHDGNLVIVGMDDDFGEEIVAVRHIAKGEDFRERYRSHFATCPDAKQHRRKGAR